MTLQELLTRIDQIKDEEKECEDTITLLLINIRISQAIDSAHSFFLDD